MQELINVIKKMHGKKILVIGDLVVDVYLDGRIGRISREAPVLILEKVGEKFVAGGAANVIANVATLGAEVYAIGVLGEDKHAERLLEIFNQLDVHIDGIVQDESRPTISKTRIIAGGRATVRQQIVRIDEESKEPLEKKFESELLSKINKILPTVDGIIMSDYGSGTITSEIRQFITQFANKNKLPNIVDSRYNIGDFEGVGYIKQNDSELENFIGYKISNVNDLIKASQTIISKLNIDGALITRGEHGMSLFEKNGTVYNIPIVDKSEVYDVSGAGDTCVAAFLLALTTSAHVSVATKIANYAAGIAVRKLGTAPVSAKELLSTLTRAK